MSAEPTCAYCDEPAQDTAAFRDVLVEDAVYPPWDGYSSLHRHFAQCGFSVEGPPQPYWNRAAGVTRVRCGGEGLYTVTRTSNLTDRTYMDYACEGHAAGWRDEKEG